MLKKLRRLILLVVVVFLGFKIYQIHSDVKNVMSYQPMVREILSDYDTVANEDLVLAMIYTETKGRDRDVMQSSESISGVTNTITDSKESIKKGIELLADNIEYANEKQVDVWTAVQAYNFGRNYIDYIAKNGGKNTLALATTYSRNVVAPSLGNTTGDTYTYYHPIALIHGGKLYTNGGNIYYSRQVRLNMYIMKMMNWF